MRRVTLTDLLNGLDGILPSQLENTARSRILRERKLVNAFLDSGGQAYGFSTFFGHLDIHEIQPGDSLNLLQAHLVGRPEPLNDRQSRAITLIKLCQLAQGGSGLSPETFEAVLRGVTTQVSIDLDASYGSGDVVPGAWWVRSILGDSPDLQRGDLIALINGSFIPEGLLLAMISPLNVAFSAIQRAAAKAQVFLQKRTAPGVQLSVSLRDLAPLENELQAGLDQFKWAIEESANRQSSNPTFSFEDDEGTPGKALVSVVSNSSFLNFECLAAVRRLGMSISVAAGYALATIKHLSSALETESSVNYGAEWVQVPKVATSYYENLLDTLTFSGSTAQWASGGTEDISDFLLAETQKIQRSVDLLGKLIQLLDQCVEAID